MLREFGLPVPDSMLQEFASSNFGRQDDPYSSENNQRNSFYNGAESFKMVNRKIKDAANEVSQSKGDIKADTFGNFKFRPAE